MKKTETNVSMICAHCGDPCDTDSPNLGDKLFCCPGCKAVYQLLHENQLDSYYTHETTPGLRPERNFRSNRFDYLDDPSIRESLLDFTDGMTARITLSIPQIHCTSCIWLLEHLYRIRPEVVASQVDFPRREVTISYKEQEISLADLIRFLASIGYEPNINLANLQKEAQDTSFRRLYTQLAIAGFCFGNVMLLSFPEYLGLDVTNKPAWAEIFGYLNILLAIPVIFYCALDFFRAAITGLRQKQINMDVPISLGLFILFSRSLYNILVLNQAGYMDSLCALVFLLLVGRLYQKKTYRSLSFDRDYRSYLPISVIRVRDGKEESIGLPQMQVGDRIRIRNFELVPADSILINGPGHIDYSFVTGESEPVSIASGQRVYAGGRQIGANIELEIIKTPSESYLMKLWTQTARALAEQPGIATLANRVSRIFTPSVLLVALLAGGYWAFIDTGRAFNAATAVLIIACPCALALSTPFALGTLHRLFGRNGFFLQSPDTIERLSDLTRVVFDKTGTITQAGTSTPVFEGHSLSEEQRRIVYSVVRQSSHPLSLALTKTLLQDNTVAVNDFLEIPGLGLEAKVSGRHVRIGSGEWVGLERPESDITTARVYVAIDEEVLGYFRFAGTYRNKLEQVISRISSMTEIAMLSGDNAGEEKTVRSLFGSQADIRFQQSPHDKLTYVNERIMQGEKVMMIGDGLNDAGALQAASVGVSIIEENASFSPACDGILESEALSKLPDMLHLAKSGMTIIRTSFAISFFYNIIGLTFAVQGLLSPVIAAILMPASSVSVVLYTTIATTIMARKRGVA
jgi:Cu+-exporting ATPase